MASLVLTILLLPITVNLPTNGNRLLMNLLLLLDLDLNERVGVILVEVGGAGSHLRWQCLLVGLRYDYLG